MPTFDKNKIEKLKFIDPIFKFLFFLKNRKRNINSVIDLNRDDKNLNIVILLFLLIGDTVMYLPAIEIIKKTYPNAKFTFVCTIAAKEILIKQSFEAEFILIDCPWISPFNKSIYNVFNFWKTLLTINKKKYDIAIDFRGDWRNIFYMNFIKSKRKISYNFSGGDYMLTDVILPNPFFFHFTDEALYLVKHLRCDYSEKESIPYLKQSIQVTQYVNDFKEKYNLNEYFIIGVHPGASQEVKRWDPQKYFQLVMEIWKTKTKCKFLIFEGPGESETVDFITFRLNHYNIPHLRIKKKLSEYIDILSLCNLVICNDSGAAHITAAHGKPVVIIFGNVDPKFVTPKSINIVKVVSHDLSCKPCNKSYCFLNTADCIKSVTVNEVMTAVNEIFLKFNEDRYAV
ncbi:glycosyltransferase family 9 protein [Hydrotalea sp.]|uniref:glycosyltransferase family 9 protein n=1 Tax=Hydrotalea sp. TaxID=2881279 RepID=UPI003D0FEE75